jgi:hypothetical protein
MRACTKCGEVKPLEAFPPVRRGEAKLQTWCRECFAEANARNYLKNHEREKARLVRQVSERRAEVRQKIVDYLQEHPCVDCGERDIVVLEFDHIGDKVADVSAYAGGGGPGRVSKRRSTSARFAVRTATAGRHANDRRPIGPWRSTLCGPP